MDRTSQRIISILLSVTFVVSSFFFVLRPTPARAVPVEELFSLPKIGEYLLKAAEAAAYSVLRKYIRQGISNLTKDMYKNLLTGGKGQDPMFETKPWDNFWQEAGDQAFGAALEGFAGGFQNELEKQKKIETAEKTLSASKEAAVAGAQAAYDTENRAIQASRDSALAPKNAQKETLTNEITASKSNLDSLLGTRNTLTNQRNTLNVQGKVSEAQAVQAQIDSINVQIQTTQGTIDTKKAAIDALDAQILTINNDTSRQLGSKYDALTQQKTQAESAYYSGLAADKKRAEVAADKKDFDVITQQKGALTEVGAAMVDLVCKPEGDISLRLLLGLAGQIDRNKREPICPYKTISTNWQNIITQTGANLNEIGTQGAWNTLAGLTNPGTSDLGAAWRIGVGGNSAQLLAKELGVTQFQSTSAQGFEPVKDLNGNATTPAGVIRQLSDKAIGAQVDDQTKPNFTGHLIADLILEAGSTFLGTSLDILQQGLRKKQVVARTVGTSNASNKVIAKLGGAGVLYSPTANPEFGVEAADVRLAAFDTLDLKPDKDWDVLFKLSQDNCLTVQGDKMTGDPDACVLDSDFVDAVKGHMTVQEAIDNKKINGGGAFGFDIASGTGKSDATIDWKRNFPYRSLVMMRKYRILPVSWELAALYIKDANTVADRCGGTASAPKNCTLDFLISKFNDNTHWAYGLIDPNWVLKVPPGFCAIKGYGPQVPEITEVDDLTKCLDPSNWSPTSGTQCNRYAKKQLVNRLETCVDYRSCLDESQEGKCGNDQRYGYCVQEQKLVRFKGESCSASYAGCEVFRDTATNTQTPYIKNGALTSVADYATGKCTAENAGCRWFSATRSLQRKIFNSIPYIELDSTNQAKINVVSGVQREWVNADKVYFASSIKKCQSEAEGCRQVSGPAGTPPYLRLPPESLQCDKDGLKCDDAGANCKVVPSYKRAECQGYALLCKAQYEGCEQYTPLDGDYAVAGKATNANTCPNECAGIIQYTEGKTLFDTTSAATTVSFSSARTRKCSLADTGCEEFTNQDLVGQGGEGKEYYTFLQQCKKQDPATVPANEVFYSIVGSESAGGQPMKFYLEGAGTPGTDAYAPKCSDGTTTSCVCDPQTEERQKYNPRIGTILCREFINSNGKVSYRWTDKLTYITNDCHPYRRTLDGQSAVDKFYTPELSKRCSLPAVGCREYRAPTAGNVWVMSYSNFEDDESTQGWQAASSPDQAVELSNEGEILGDHSLKLKKNSSISNSNGGIIKKTMSFVEKTPYTVSFSVKGPAGGTAGIYLEKKSGTSASPIYPDSLPGTLSGSWQRFQFVFSEEKVVNLANKDLFIMVTTAGGANIESFLIDDIVVKEIDGIEYVIKDSWNNPTQCMNNGVPQYQNCSLYSNRQGTQVALTGFQQICPNEMVGCVSGNEKFTTLFDDGLLGIWNTPQTLSKSTIQEQGGQKFLHVNSPSAYISSLFPIKPNSNYKVSFDLRLGSESLNRLRIQTGIVNGTFDQWYGDDTANSIIKKTTEWQHIEISFTQGGAVGSLGISKTNDAADSFDMDNLTIEKIQYIVSDGSKSCQASDSKCTAYGSPKLTGNGALQKIKNTAGVSAANSWSEKEDWNIAYYKVTPEEAQIGQSSLAYGDVSPYSSGICRGPTYSGTTITHRGDLDCREYLAGGKQDKAYFRDPGVNVCYPEENGAKWYYKTCGSDKTILCSQDSDCPVKADGTQDTCSGKQACAADGKGAAGTPAAGKQFVNSCPASASGCRKITDPECSIVVAGSGKCFDDSKNSISCTDNTSCKLGSTCEFDHTLRNDYGRSSSGIPCVRDYYLTDSLDTRVRECNGKVDVEKGCLLFDDANAEKYEYRKAVDPTSGNLIPKIAPENIPAADKPINYCRCDTNALTDTDCPDKPPASSFDPEFCYNRTKQTTSAVGTLLQKYKRYRIDSAYKSEDFYPASGATLSLNTNAGCLANIPTETCDSNTLIKVQQDRTCKTWLNCTAYSLDQAGNQVCYKSGLCNKWGSGNQCALTGIINTVDLTPNNGSDDKPMVAKGMLVLHSGTAPMLIPLSILRSLSGVARPDAWFKGGVKTTGGHNLDFTSWKQDQSPQQTAGSYTYTQSVLSTQPVGNVWNENLSFVANSCRLYPRVDSPKSTSGQLVDSCRTDSGSFGLYGFCLEPHPSARNDFQPGRYVCTNNTNSDCQNASGAPDNGKCPSGGKCVYKYYENFCLNWFPVDRIQAQQNLFLSSATQEASVYSGPADVYYCISTETVPDTTPKQDFQYRTAAAYDKWVRFGHLQSLDECDTFKPWFSFKTDQPGVVPSSCLHPETHARLESYALIIGADLQTAIPSNSGGINGTIGRNSTEQTLNINLQDVDSIDFYLDDIGLDCDHCRDDNGNENPSYRFMAPGDGPATNAHKGPYDWAVYSNYASELGSWQPANSSSTYCPQLVYDHGDGWALAIRASDNINHSFGGYDYIVCPPQNGEHGTMIFSLGVKFNFKATYDPRKVYYSYNQTYCKEFVAAVKNGEAVPDVSQAAANGTYTIKGSFTSPPTGRILLKQQGIGWTNCTEAEDPNSIPRISGLNCTGKPIVEDDLMQPTDPRYIRILGDINGLRAQTPFVKGYDYYIYSPHVGGLVNTYTKTAEWGGGAFNALAGGVVAGYNQLVGFWSATRGLAKGVLANPNLGGNYPHIYGLNQGDRDHFEAHADSTDPRNISVRFYTKVSDRDRPIKHLNVEFFEPGSSSASTVIPIENSSRDGHGIGDTYNNAPTTGSAADDKFNGHGPYYNSFTAASIAGAKVCVTVVDNWNAGTKTCGIFNASGAVASWDTSDASLP